MYLKTKMWCSLECIDIDCMWGFTSILKIDVRRFAHKYYDKNKTYLKNVFLHFNFVRKFDFVLVVYLVGWVEN